MNVPPDACPPTSATFVVFAAAVAVAVAVAAIVLSWGGGYSNMPGQEKGSRGGSAVS